MFKRFICWAYGHDFYWIYTGGNVLELREKDINYFPGANIFMMCSRCGVRTPKW